jgi:hypothetical protein
MPISVDRLATLNELEAVGPVWNALQDACGHQHVMMDHRWIHTWWRHFGHGKAQHTLLLSSGGTAVGIIPLAITRGMEAFPFRDPYLCCLDDYPSLPSLRFQRLVPLRRLTFPLNLASANNRGLAIFPQPARELYGAVGRYAAENAGSWDVATLSGMRTWDREDLVLAAAAANSGLSVGTRESDRTTLYIDLPSTFSEFMQSRTSHFRSRLQGDCNRLERTFAALGKMTINRFRGPDLPAGLERLFSLERQSWKVSGEKDRRMHLALDERGRRFFQEVGVRFAADDEAQVLIVGFGETDAVGMFTLERGDTAVGVVTYRSERLGSPVGIAPLWRELLQGYIERGFRTFDINGYTRNYLKWATGERRYGRPTLFNKGAYSRTLHALDEMALRIGRRRRNEGARSSSVMEKAGADRGMQAPTEATDPFG